MSTALGVNTINVKGLQQQLVKAGYKIKVDGQLGPLTLSALRDYYGQPNENLSGLKTELADSSFTTKSGGVGHPSAWNKTHVNVSAPLAPAKTNSDGTPAPGMSTAGYTNPTAVDFKPVTQALDTNTYSDVPMSLSKFGKMIDPNTAQDIAGAQFDPQITAAQLAVNEDPLQAAQNLKDIGSWYGQVGAAQQTAAARDRQQTAAGTGSIGDAAAALASSLGGGANEGSTAISDAGQNAQGTIAAIGAATNEYNNDIAPLLAAEGAEQKVGQSRLDAKQALADKANLTALQTSKGEAAQAALAQIEQENNALSQARASVADQILGQNNSGHQQNFSNQMALTNAQIAALMSGLSVAGTEAKNAKAENPNAFVYASADAKSRAQLSALNSLANLSKQGLKISPSAAHQVIAGMYQGNGWNPADPDVAQAIGATMNVWANTVGGGV